MDVQQLLRVLLANCAAPQAREAPSDTQAAPTEHNNPPQESRSTLADVFATLWVGELALQPGRRDEIGAAIAFLLPGGWGGEPCDDFLLRSDTTEKQELAFAASEEPFRGSAHQARGQNGDFFAIVKKLVALLQPVLQEQQPLLQTWTLQLDTILASLQSFFVTLHAALFTSFCDADKQLSVSQWQDSWRFRRHQYATSLCELCHLVDAQLFALVTSALAHQFVAASGCTATQIFTGVGFQSPESAADSVALLVESRLVDLALAAAKLSKFADVYPSETQTLPLAAAFIQAGSQKLRDAFLSYVDRALQLSPLSTSPSHQHHFASKEAQSAVASNQRQTVVDEPKAAAVQHPSASATALKTIAQSCAPVSLDGALSLVAAEGKELLLSRVSEMATADNRLLTAVTTLLATQTKADAALLHGSTFTALDTHSPDAAPKMPAQSDRKACSASPHIQSKSPSSQPIIVLAHGKGSHKETWLFWTRLQRKLGLDDAATQRASERVKFDNESPVPGVFMVDLDVRNNDRASLTFLERARELLGKASAGPLSAHNTRLLKEACVSFAKELVEKTGEVQTSLPFLPTRVGGPLLGSLYAPLRADKQFQSLKQIYMQSRQLQSKAGGSAADRAMLENIEQLIQRRVEVLAKLVSEEESAAAPLKPSLGPRNETKNRWSLPSLSAVVAEAHIKSDAVLAHEAQKRRGSSASGQQAVHTPSQVGHRPSVIASVFHARRSIINGNVPLPPPDTRIEEVYRSACRFYGVPANSGLEHELQKTKENVLTTLDLSGNYVGVRGLKPVLTLLEFNGGHLISLSLRNNNLESDDIAEACQVLEGEAGTNLVHLDLSFNSFSSSVFPTLWQLISKLPHLNTLVLKGTLLSRQLIDELEAAVAKKAAARFSAAR